MNQDILNFKIISLNVNSLMHFWKRKCLFTFVKENSIKIVILQETHLISANYNWRLWDNEFIIFEGKCNRHSQGIAIIIHVSTNPNLIDILFDDQRLLVVKIMLWNQIFVITSFYASFNANINKNYYGKILLMLKRNINYYLILAGDLNQVNFPNSKIGSMLLQQLDLHNMANKNVSSNQNTHYTSNSSSAIDYIFVSRVIFETCTLKLLKNMISDHVILVVSGEMKFGADSSFQKRFVILHPALTFEIDFVNLLYIWSAPLIMGKKIEKQMWDNFKVLLKNEILIRNKHFVWNLNQESKFLNNIMIDADGLSQYSPDVITSLRNRFTELQDMNLKLKKYQLLKKRKLDKNDFKALTNTSLFYILKPNKNISVIKEKGVLYTGSRLRVLLNEHFKNKFESQQSDKLQYQKVVVSQQTEELHENMQLEKLFNYANILANLKKLNKKSPPGQDAITTKIYLHFAYIFVPIFEKLFKGWASSKLGEMSEILSYFVCFKKSASVQRTPKDKSLVQFSRLGDIRPINIENIDAKLYGKILNEALMPILSHTIHPNQFAVKGRTIYNAIFLLQEAHLIAKKDRHANPIVLFLDMSQAFDRVDHLYLIEKLQIMISDKTLAAAIKNYIIHKSGTIKHENKLDTNFKIRRGIAQGSPLSSGLFCIYINELLCDLHTNLVGVFLPSIGGNLKIIAFADDLLAICQDRIEMELVLQIIGSYKAKAGIMLNEEKTSACLLKSFAHVKVFNEAKTEKFLGLPHPFFGTTARIAIQQRIIKDINVILNALKNSYLSIKLRIKVINTMCIPKLNYVAPFYNFPRSFVNSLNCIFNKFIWQGKLPLISKNTFYFKQKLGGFGLIKIDIFLKMLKVNALSGWCKYLDNNGPPLFFEPTDTPPPWFPETIMAKLLKCRKDFIDDFPSSCVSEKFHYYTVRDLMFTEKNVIMPLKIAPEIIRFMEKSYSNYNIFDFTLKLCYGRLPTTDLLTSKYLMRMENICPLCGANEETLDHLFCVCPYFLELRKWVEMLLKRDILVFKKIFDLLNYMVRYLTDLRLLILVLFSIWKIRCMKIFKDMRLRPILYVKMELKKLFQSECSLLKDAVVRNIWPMARMNNPMWNFMM